MIALQNPKISTLTPRWAEFRGFSLLFDNPGRDQLGDHDLLACRPAGQPELALYRALEHWQDTIGRSALLLEHGLAAMPASTFHVTAWDGINAATLAALNPRTRAAACAWLDALPGPADWPDALAVAQDARDALQALLPIRFAYGALRNTRGIGIVAELAPADEEQAERFEAFQRCRLVHAERAHAQWGQAYTTRLEPHVTLGYFLSPMDSERAQPRIGDWDAQLRDATAGLSLRFDSIGLYGFTDMVRFYRRAA